MAKKKKRPTKKKSKKRGKIATALSKIPEKVTIRGGESEIKTKQGSVKTKYKKLEVGK